MGRKILLTEGTVSHVLSEVDAHDEASLQESLKQHPELVPIEDFDLSGPMLVIGREAPLPSGAVDLVGLARGGEILIIEFKTGPQNPDFRHATSQLIDYGSDMWTMDFETFESSVILRYFGSDRCPVGSPGYGKGSLQAAAQGQWPDLTEEDFAALRAKMEQQLASGRFIYVSVAQRFTDSSEQTIRYLNATMSSAFYALELVRFVEGDLEAFEARTLFKPEGGHRNRGAGRDVVEGFYSRFEDPTLRARIESFLETCRGLRYRFEFGDLGVSIRIVVPDRKEPVTVAWVFPPGASGWMGLRNVSLGLHEQQLPGDSPSRSALESYVEQVAQIPGSRDVGRRDLRGCELDPTSEAASDAAVELLTSLAQRVHDMSVT
jgi:hypothetical protein